MWNTAYDTMFMLQCKCYPTLQRAEHIIIFFSKVHLWETKQMLMRHVAVIKTLYKDYNKALDSSLSAYERPITISRDINNRDSGFEVKVNDCLERRGFTRLSVTHGAPCKFAALLQTSLCVGESKKSAILQGARTRLSHSVGLKLPDFML